jgi:hypothetical protein
MDIDGPRLDVAIVPPDAFEQLIARQQPVLVLNEMSEHSNSRRVRRNRFRRVRFSRALERMSNQFGDIPLVLDNQNAVFSLCVSTCDFTRCRRRAL